MPNPNGSISQILGFHTQLSYVFSGRLAPSFCASYWPHFIEHPHPKARGGATACTLFAANIAPPCTPLGHLPFPLLSDGEEGDF